MVIDHTYHGVGSIARDLRLGFIVLFIPGEEIVSLDVATFLSDSNGRHILWQVYLLDKKLALLSTSCAGFVRQTQRHKTSHQMKRAILVFYLASDQKPRIRLLILSNVVWDILIVSVTLVSLQKTITCNVLSQI